MSLYAQILLDALWTLAVLAPAVGFAVLLHRTRKGRH